MVSAPGGSARFERMTECRWLGRMEEIYRNQQQ